MSEKQPENPVETSAKIGSYRVLRGGNWYGIPINLESASRNYSYPSALSSNFGFRIARTVKK